MPHETRLSRRDFTRGIAGTLAGVWAGRALGDTPSPTGFSLNYILGSPMYGYAALEEIVPEVRKTGAASIDIWPKVHGNQREQLDEMGEERFAALLRTHDVSLGCITQYKLGPFGLQDEMRLARRLGCRLIVTGGKGPKGLAGSELKAAVAAFLEQMKPHLAVAEETGLLTLHVADSVKDIYLVDGDPHYVTSNLAEELFGQYLMQVGALSQGELSMALAMLPHFEGKLGNALVALKLLRPVQVLRHLTHQVRQKLLNAFQYEAGVYLFFKDRQSDQESAPLGLEAFEIIGAGVQALSEEMLIKRLQSSMSKRPRSVSTPPVPPEVFRLGSQPREIFDRLDGRRTLLELLQQYDDAEQRQSFARIVYLLLQTQLAVA